MYLKYELKQLEEMLSTEIQQAEFAPSAQYMQFALTWGTDTSHQEWV